ncbi:VOC family protein [Kineococcus rhizosphaerae]|uniref:Putative enzyme related to lactoylglutathione lyase n=1 Tax=Kineococcus rhizosphaerae TaxID=559628 RepID=A0A2T0R1Z4_9ACTN|nr:VOC family protein [Kineococcus rhizosphaerae]PRY13550.1 putative enzyme related to lactoylglutathione lyase [Kineococcus rhizosphaerae]
MASGVATVWVPVDDMDRAVAFYGQTLGLDVTSTSPDWSEIDAGGLMIGLNGREETATRSAGGAVISFQPDGGLDDEVARLKDAGVEFTGPISDHEWGRIAPFKDSEGNDLQFYAPPA